MRMVLASSNRHKAEEITAMLPPNFEINLQSDLGIDSVAETGTAFIENALIKARHASALTGMPAIADDSGLEVDSLSGEPGVRSARYGGDSCTSDQDRVNLLLKNLENVPWEERGARFRSVIAVAEPRKSHQPTLVTQAEGSVAGMIQYSPQGDDGFGYDPVFYLPSYDKTVAQLPLDVKNKISHRATATQKAVQTLKKLITES